jgi:photosystem II stability/assembly factor-like uncharacterized protein
MIITNQLRTVVAALFMLAAGFTAGRAQSWETVYNSPTTEYNPRIFASPSGQLLTREYVQSSNTFLFRRSSDRGLTWPTIATIPGNPDPSFKPSEIAFTPSGATIALGGGSVAISTDQGATWTTLEPPGFYPEKIAVHPSGQLFAVGSPQGDDLLVRRSVDGGHSWQTVDGTTNFAPRTIAASASAVVVSGQKQTATGNAWVTRRSLDGGNTWATVNEFVYSSGALHQVLRSAAGPNGRFYTIATVIFPNNGANHWLVRRSTDGGTTWGTVDDFIEAVPSARGAAIAVDGSGQVFAVGSSLDGISGAQSPPWRVRRSTNGGNTWQTIDKFPMGGAITYADAKDVAVDALGNVLVIGVANYNGDMQHTRSLIRKLPGPPQLSSIQGGQQLRLSWTTNSPGFVLQSATSLTNGGDWQVSSLTPIVTNGQNTVTVNPTSPAGFFRLRQP